MKCCALVQHLGKIDSNRTPQCFEQSKIFATEKFEITNGTFYTCRINHEFSRDLGTKNPILAKKKANSSNMN